MSKAESERKSEMDNKLYDYRLRVEVVGNSEYAERWSILRKNPWVNFVSKPIESEQYIKIIKSLLARLNLMDTLRGVAQQ